MSLRTSSAEWRGWLRRKCHCRAASSPRLWTVVRDRLNQLIHVSDLFLCHRGARDGMLRLGAYSEAAARASTCLKVRESAHLHLCTTGTCVRSYPSGNPLTALLETVKALRLHRAEGLPPGQVALGD